MGMKRRETGRYEVETFFEREVRLRIVRFSGPAWTFGVQEIEFEGVQERITSLDRQNEFRSALISAAVLGKIDVREEVQ